MDTNIILESLYYLSKQLNKSVDKLSAIKLLFFADRYHLRKYGRLISEDTYYALPHGPVASNSLNIINEILIDNSVGSDRIYIVKTDKKDTFIATKDNLELEYLSNSDIEALDFVIEHFANKYKAWELRDLSHEYPEWKRYQHTLDSESSKREKIIMDDFFQNANISNDPYNIIDDNIVELSKELFKNAYWWSVIRRLSLKNTVFYFENIEHDEDDRKPHYHIAIKTNNNRYIVVVMFTSQIEKRETHRAINPDALSSLIYADENDFNFLSKKSVIDCNNPLYKTKEELNAIVDNLQPIPTNISEEFRDSIINAIKTSPIVRPNIKKALP